MKALKEDKLIRLRPTGWCGRQLLLCAMLCLIAACGAPDNQPSPANSTTEDSAAHSVDPAQLALSARPADEVRLESLLKEVNDADDALFNQKNAITAADNFNKAYMEFCSAMQNQRGTIRDWTAVIKSIYAGGSTSKPAISITTPQGIGAYQEIGPGSRLFKFIQNAKEGDYVKFSLKIDHADEAGGIYKECDHLYDGGEVPHLNTTIGGEITELSPLK